ncbi:MJ0042-type zinc finger domain-containing protein [Acinetobacter sp. ANC 3791]|uniref:MJ0042-type zinc finger domain-containing protein n=1 Tax=Acinetobacter sp. ANC 3791 TaxID=2529836 RepID=UPI00103BE862|nr:MJ0042-type zinc finger domain-containing protein [Acinetobacter sp. ANC 3791]TCB85844.1 hypothetical protein E0H90_03100 [Acinetobacter sp. ANC 3791]
MCDIQTQCPNCKTQYLISPTQLSIAQGMVCCAKCDHNFNAYELLSHSPYVIQLDSHFQNVTLLTHHQIHERGGAETVLAIFDRKLDSSNTDLLNYLNSHQFSEEHQFDFKKPDSFFNFSKNTSTRFFNLSIHVFLFVLNIIVFGFVVSQITNNNNDLKQQFPLLAIFSTHTCSMVKCSTKTVNALQVETTHIDEDYPGLTTITGKLVNNSDHPQSLPSIQIVTAQKVFSFMPTHYLPLQQQHKQHVEAKQTQYFRIDIPSHDAHQPLKLQLKTSSN